jgi:hypothetical protein
VKLTNHLHLVPRSRMRGAIPPLLQYAFMAWCLVKHRNNFTFYLGFLLSPLSKSGSRRKKEISGGKSFVNEPHTLSPTFTLRPVFICSKICSFQGDGQSSHLLDCEYGGSKIGILRYHYKASQPRRPRLLKVLCIFKHSELASKNNFQNFKFYTSYAGSVCRTIIILLFQFF